MFSFCLNFERKGANSTEKDLKKLKNPALEHNNLFPLNRNGWGS